MKTQLIVKPEAKGTYSGRAYKGLVVAVCGKHKGITRTYLPDVFDENIGLKIALAKLGIKQSRDRLARLQKQTEYEFEWFMKQTDIIERRVESESAMMAFHMLAFETVLKEQEHRVEVAQ